MRAMFDGIRMEREPKSRSVKLWRLGRGSCQRCNFIKAISEGLLFLVVKQFRTVSVRFHFSDMLSVRAARTWVLTAYFGFSVF